MSADYLRLAPSTRRFFDGAPFEAVPNDLPALFGLRVEIDPYMPDGFVAVVRECTCPAGRSRPRDRDNPFDIGPDIQIIDLRPKGN